MRKIQLSILMILLWKITFAQGTGFITLNGRQFHDKTGAPFFPMVMNYHVNIVHDQQGPNPQYKVVRSLDYGTDKCSLEGGYSFADCENSLIDDFARISQMGFNTVRIIGDLSPFRRGNGFFGFQKWSGIYNFGTANGEFCGSNSRKYFNLYPPYTSADCNTFFNLIGHLLDIADQYNMKVIFLATEASGCNNTSQGIVCSPDRGSSLADAMDYASYLTELAKVIKDKPALLAYDLYNEPFWLIWDNGRNMDKKKDTVCQYVSLWYDAIKGEDPNHLVTLGGTDYNDVLYWDTGVMKIDFVSVHTYPYPDDNNITPANSAILWEDIINQFHFYTEALGKPWIIGETGFSASDETCLANKIWGDEADQVNYFSEILSAVRDCGGSGFSWWLFQDIHWYCVDNTVCTPTCSYCRICDTTDPLSVVGDIDQNYFGLQKYTDPDPLTGQYSTADLKSAAQVSIDFDEGNGVPALAPCDAPTSFYYDPSHFSTLNTNTSTYLTGRIEDQDGNAISSAVIIAQNWLYTIDPTSLPDDEEHHHQYIHTFSNDNTLGNNFTVIPYTPFNPNDPRIVYLKASAVGASKVEVGGWGSDVAMNQNLGAIILDKMTLDYDSEIDNIVISTSSQKKDYHAWNTLKFTNTTINSGVISELVARNDINIMSNFNAEYGSEVHIYLDETFPECSDYTGFLRTSIPGSENYPVHETSNQKQIKLSFQKSISKLNIKPNPSSGKYSVKIDSETDIKTMNLIIRNTLGEEMIKKEFAGFEYEIDLSNFINGIYFLELFNNEQKFNEILVKN